MLMRLLSTFESDMAAKRNTPDYQRRQTACVSLGKRILERSGLNQTELEPHLNFAESHGSKFGKFARGKEVPSHERIISVAVAAFHHGWLTHEELQEMGFLKSPFNKLSHGNKTLPGRRQLAIEKFERCLANMRAGLLPYAMRGPNGRELRPPKNTVEFLEERQKWIADIESLGGEVRYLPYMRRPTQRDQSLRFFEEDTKFHNWELFLEWREGDFVDRLAQDALRKMSEGFDPDDYDSWESYDAAVQAAAEERMRTTFDPAVIDPTLYLWFGGRDHLHPYLLIDEDDISPSLEHGIPPEEFYAASEDPGQSDNLNLFISRKVNREAADSVCCQ
jgi:hypothetical protein